MAKVKKTSLRQDERHLWQGKIDTYVTMSPTLPLKPTLLFLGGGAYHLFLPHAGTMIHVYRMYVPKHNINVYRSIQVACLLCFAHSLTRSLARSRPACRPGVVCEDKRVCTIFPQNMPCSSNGPRTVWIDRALEGNSTTVVCSFVLCTCHVTYIPRRCILLVVLFLPFRFPFKSVPLPHSHLIRRNAKTKDNMRDVEI